ncbi:3-hydroxyacyl-CoA dehydrogenase family protein [Reinekea sp. G2M2-21]|uniref:3-hydroxyacyl-CoA dehydrogenase family protein n=1 Tax=Reinekea sp. G2M2-21 TaxID=2788942 RepID=UPI0018A8C255|nr:3-hydroxyacyl-CoA dehydrogenase NAD-binding domain-containing protein [Reinekea sp. G2M2-21]
MFRKIGVAGAGVMGVDVALDLAANGFDVVVYDSNQSVIDSLLESISDKFVQFKLFVPGYKGVSIDQIVDRITVANDLCQFGDIDLVIENITEDTGLKKQLYQALDKVCNEDTVFAANTSCVSITKIGSWVSKPELVLGAHLMNPVPMKELVEVVRGTHTDESTISNFVDFARKWGKDPVVVNDFPGFVTNRVLMLTINEAIGVVQDAISSPSDVDKIFCTGFGHKMGPLATGDLIGLDTILKSLEVLYESFNDPKFRPYPLLRKMVDAGQLGRKSGKGFFSYS